MTFSLSLPTMYSTCTLTFLSHIIRILTLAFFSFVLNKFQTMHIELKYQQWLLWFLTVLHTYTYTGGIQTLFFRQMRCYVGRYICTYCAELQGQSFLKHCVGFQKCLNRKSLLENFLSRLFSFLSIEWAIVLICFDCAILEMPLLRHKQSSVRSCRTKQTMNNKNDE
jgi:hypothetical protein